MFAGTNGWNRITDGCMAKPALPSSSRAEKGPASPSAMRPTQGTIDAFGQAEVFQALHQEQGRLDKIHLMVGRLLSDESP
jgi:hypothetical protein